VGLGIIGSMKFRREMVVISCVFDV